MAFANPVYSDVCAASGGTMLPPPPPPLSNGVCACQKFTGKTKKQVAFPPPPPTSAYKYFGELGKKE